MTERQMQFRVGLLALGGIGVTCFLAFQFSGLPKYLTPTYSVSAHFPDAPGLQPGVPVRQFGLSIGRVETVEADFDRGGVMATLALKQSHPLRADAVPQISRSLLGDASIEFSGGRSAERMTGGTTVVGIPATDPMQVVADMQETATVTLASFEATSNEWRQLAANANSLIETEQGSLREIVRRSSTALEELTLAMGAATQTLSGVNEIMADPAVQQDLKRTIASLPLMVDETRRTIASVQAAVAGIEGTMGNLAAATEPMARNAPVLTNSLGRSLVQLESVMGDVSKLSAAISREDGTITQLAGDPALYQNLNTSAKSLAILLRNLDPVIRDLRVFSDKVARHPEMLGVRGAIRASSGLKDEAADVRAQNPRR